MSYNAVVYDLDGTLVRLAVDWDEVASDVERVLRERGIEPETTGLWDMLQQSEQTDDRPAVESVIAEHERTGARNSERLPLADGLPHQVPVGVCSLNAESACRLALAVHGLEDHVGPVVGRDSVGSEKPDPEGLLAVAGDLGVAPEETVFVGDSQRDATAAERAGMAFQWATEFDQRRYRA